MPASRAASRKQRSRYVASDSEPSDEEPRYRGRQKRSPKYYSEDENGSRDGVSRGASRIRGGAAAGDKLESGRIKREHHLKDGEEVWLLAKGQMVKVWLENGTKLKVEHVIKGNTAPQLSAPQDDVPVSRNAPQRDSKPRKNETLRGRGGGGRGYVSTDEYSDPESSLGRDGRYRRPTSRRRY